MYGGTFDPPHIGHVYACKSFLEAYSVDKIYIVPTLIPPHKSRSSSVNAEMRLEMAKLAFEGISKNVEISNIEIMRQGKSYTADTLKQFKDMGADQIYLLCGTDMFVTLDMWYNPKYIFEAATVVCIRRESDLKMTSLIEEKSAFYKEKFGAKVEFIYKDAVEISSTDLRNTPSNLKELVPQSVYEYIKKNKLYENEN
jgi:nicotinate-nucleotide adenylyltransferase